MQLTNKNIVPAALLAGAILVLAMVLFLKTSAPLSASVSYGSEYHGTTTQSTPNLFPIEALLQTGGGTLGSVTITGAAAGSISVYDATTSNILLRGNTPTSTIFLAAMPTSTAAGTYTFDRVFYNGLYVVTTGVVPTSTITFR